MEDLIDDLMFEDIDQDPIVELDKTTEQPVEETPITEESDESDLATITFNTFLEKGYVEQTDDNKFDGTFEWIEKELDTLPDKIQTTLISNVAPVGQDLLDFILTSGKNLTKETLETFVTKHLTQESLTVDTADEAREYLESVYLKAGMKPKAITAQLDDLEDSDELLDVAQKEIEKEKTSTKKIIQEVKEKTKEEKKAQEEFNQSISENILTLPKTRQSLVYETAKKAPSLINEIAKDPKSYVQFMNILSYYKDGVFDLSVFEKQGESKATSKLKEKIMASNIRSASKGDTVTDTPLTKNYEFIV